MLSGGWAICRISAARVKLSSSATAMKYRSRRISMISAAYGNQSLLYIGEYKASTHTIAQQGRREVAGIVACPQSESGGTMRDDRAPWLVARAMVERLTRGVPAVALGVRSSRTADIARVARSSGHHAI